MESPSKRPSCQLASAGVMTVAMIAVAAEVTRPPLAGTAEAKVMAAADEDELRARRPRKHCSMPPSACSSTSATPASRRARLAEEAGVNHGLVHYYFGSNENLLVRALERFTAGLIARQRELYAADMPFVEKWRTAMRYLVSEDVTYEKIWLELQALAWNNPDLRERLARVNAEWRAVLTEAFAEPHRELGIDMPLDALVSLVMTFNIGIMVERLGGIEAGHAELLDWIDGWLSS